MLMPEVNVFSDKEQLARAVAEHVTRLAAETIDNEGRFTIALSGGSTPQPVYALLASQEFARRIDWSRVHVFWGDERCVPPDDPQSNYRMARETLLDHLPLSPFNVHRMRGEDEPQSAARDYEQQLQRFFGVDDERDGLPLSGLHLILLGMGADGHTASLFPGTAAAMEQKRWVVDQYVEAVNMWRITLTPVFINAASNVAFIVSGADKSERLRQVLKGPAQPHLLPAQAIRPERGRVGWFLDKAAASGLEMAG